MINGTAKRCQNEIKNLSDEIATAQSQIGATCKMASNRVLGQNCHVDSLVREQIDQNYDPNEVDFNSNDEILPTKPADNWMGLNETTIKTHPNYVEIRINSRALANKIVEMWSTPFEFRHLMQMVQELVT